MATSGLKKVVILKKVEIKEIVKEEQSKITEVIKKEVKVKEMKKKEVKKKDTKDTLKPKKIIKKNIWPKVGQTKATPPESDPLRKFYTSLLKQNNKSEMAIKWCTEHGLMPKQEENITYSISKLTI